MQIQILVLTFLFVLNQNHSVAQPVLHYSDSLLVTLMDGKTDWGFDIRYARRDNAFGVKLYSVEKPMLVKPAADSLKKVHERLKKQGFGLLIYDAYRPWSITKILWEKVDSTRKKYVANPARGSRHNRACAVDVGLIDLKTGKPAEMPTDYDDFTEKAASDYEPVSENARKNRLILRQMMEVAGFKSLKAEWWHFDFSGWERYPILDVKLEE